MKFIFDLDTAIIKNEALPIIASRFGEITEIKKITNKVTQGNIPFEEGFICAVNTLRKYSVKKTSDIFNNAELFDEVVNFINENRDDCIVLSSNLNVWVGKLLKKFKCKSVTSTAVVKGDSIQKIEKIIRKEDVIKRLQDSGEKVVYIGGGNSDAEAMRLADVAIASGLVCMPVSSVLAVATFAVFHKKTFIKLLNQIKFRSSNSKTVVLSCAGIGSRLGMGGTKALIDIKGKPLIHWQIKLFNEVDDLRIVVGFQARDVIKTVLQARKDVLFVYNHEYFSTKTGMSLYLGSRYANKLVVAWDGDLLVHSDDVVRCLKVNEPYVAYSKTITDDAVYLHLNKYGQVSKFSRTEKSQYEWSGPACFERDTIQCIDGHVYQQIEVLLPLKAVKVRAFDIDTQDDYKYALKIFKTLKYK